MPAQECVSDQLQQQQEDELSQDSPVSTSTADVLYPIRAEEWVYRYPRWVRNILAYLSMTLFAWSFLVIPVSIILTLLAFSTGHPNISAAIILTLLSSFIIPSTEWRQFRMFGQLWYELLDFRVNLSPEQCAKYVDTSEAQQYILAMHPHGMVPFHAILYASFCDQCFTTAKTSLYGFGAAANVVLYLPFLRNIMGWLSVSSADQSSLRKRLVNYPLHSNEHHSNTKHLFLLPGGIAEIYTSQRGKHVIVFKKRKGLVRLSLETGAQLIPVYVFGATDFFDNTVAGDHFIARLARKLRMGIAVFTGPLLLPIPYLPRVTFCFAEPVRVNKWDASKGPVPEALVDELHCQVLTSLHFTLVHFTALISLLFLCCICSPLFCST